MLSEKYHKLYADTVNMGWNELFELLSSGLIRSVSGGNQCLGASDAGNGKFRLRTFKCSPERHNQKYAILLQTITNGPGLNSTLHHQNNRC